MDNKNGALDLYLARRLLQIGVTDVFSVPGDFNLTLLDYLIAEPGLSNIGCCNELNAGYVAYGYARWRGVGACVVTFTVGGLSLLNAIAGAYSEDLPVICIVGGPNSNDFGSDNRILHHTIGLPDFSQELRCFQNVTCYQAVINNLEDGSELIDTAISIALKESKPVYICISCNSAGIPHPTFRPEPVPISFPPRFSNQMALEASVGAAADLLDKAVKTVMVADAFAELADASGYALAVQSTTLISLGHTGGSVSTAFCSEIVESADAYLFAGSVFNDYSSVGYSALLKKEKAVIVQPDRVTIGNGPAFGCVLLKCAPTEPLRVNVLFQHVQNMLSSQTAVIADTGDSWFNCQELKLPPGCRYEFQMQYESIGASLGYAQAAPTKRVIAFIGDGRYTIEVEIHDGPYNVIKNWGYTGLIDAIHNGEGKCWTTKVRCEDELIEATEVANGDKKECSCFIEVIVHKDDTSKELLQWGSRFAAANSRPPSRHQ
ncbi:hypothetical protein PRUPE_6G280700 [Prunus persica]|uniref:pyruvate decarboxylase n=1 Tax=Prunus persica TaxID=3760 RepID=M5WJD9_PRUPE|nr:hypothetical protein PRUPE_6G280700 [Prunus persica]